MQEKIINIIKEEPFTGEDGLQYNKITKEILTPRKTYLKGTISGKYRGDRIPDEYDKSDLFDFEIYEAEVLCNSIDDFSKNKPFVFPDDFKNIGEEKKIKAKVFPKSKLPEILPVIITANEKTFGINVLEPKLYEFEIIRKYHQTEGDEVFGMFNAFITGYVIDFESEEVEEIVGPIVEDIIIEETFPKKLVCIPSIIETGKIETKGNYIRKEFKCKNHNDNVWGSWEYTGGNRVKPPVTGCVGEIIAGIGILLFLIFLMAILPGIAYFAIFYVALLLIGLIAPYLKWVFRILGIILLIAFFGSMFRTCTNTLRNYSPPRIVQDVPKEINPVIEPIVETNRTSDSDSVQRPELDTIITRYRSWQDYDGNQYEGKYQIKLSTYRAAHNYKNNINLRHDAGLSYNEMVYKLSQFDKNAISGAYKLFDSIGKANKHDQIKFAKMIVSFVQDIPYSIVLDNECDPNLYNDPFTRNYLLKNQGDCAPNERFGINTPVEFLAYLKGDCDTRTLLLYTILSHYNYDVALMSSEFYSHSLIGINLPIDGIAYTYNNQRYVLWETTNRDIRPGILSNEISNLNNWRISLKSK